MLRNLLPLFAILFFLSACQKEISFGPEAPAHGSLQDDNHECFSKTVNGSYVMNLQMNADNYMDVMVDITQTGAYKIFSDTLNGYYFKGEGVFTKTGTSTVRLKAMGKPLAMGMDHFTVFFDSSQCTQSVEVTDEGSNDAIYTLESVVANSCSVINIKGTYTQGTPVTTVNTVSLSVNAATLGTWYLSTPTVSGLSFQGAGTFTKTGVQTITLTASGTPSASGPLEFDLAASGSTCVLVVDVKPGTVPAPSSDYFPLGSNSWWSYYDRNRQGEDTMKTVVNGIEQRMGKTYQRLITTHESGNVEVSLVRKDNSTGSYYKFLSASDIKNMTGFTIDQEGWDILFLKDKLTKDASFSSDFSVKIVGNYMTATIRFKTTVMDANASVSIDDRNFTNVYVIKTEVLEIIPGAGVVNQDSQIDYFAKGIGLIKTGDREEIRNWHIN